MKKIKNFFSQIGGGITMIVNKIFKKNDVEFQQEKMKKRLVWLIAIIIVVIIIAAIIAVIIYRQAASKNSLNATIANPIAEAKITIVTSRNCGSKCWDVKLFTDALVQQGIKIDDKKIVYTGGWWPFNQGTEIAKQYQITKVPTAIVEFTGNTKLDINKFFSPTLGNVVNSKFVLTKILAPYFDLTEKKLNGMITITYLTDRSCAQCYDVKKHEVALKNLGASTANSQTVDISSPAGQARISEYNITKVPTMLITGEVGEYAILTQAWKEVGTIASDGTYIFTNLDLMGDYYKDLATGKIIKANPPVATSTPAQ